MKLICPECKNEVDLSNYSNLEVEHIVECNHCGITLMVEKIENDIVETQIVDEGK